MKMKNPTIPTQAGRVFAPGLKNRGFNQHQRVGQGIRSGELTDSELATLKEHRTEHQKMLTAFKANDGIVGPRERMALHRDLNGISQAIYTFKHN